MSARRTPSGPGGVALDPPGNGRSNLFAPTLKCTTLPFAVTNTGRPCAADGIRDAAARVGTSSAVTTACNTVDHFSLLESVREATKVSPKSGGAGVDGGL